VQLINAEMQREERRTEQTKYNWVSHIYIHFVCLPFVYLICTCKQGYGFARFVLNSKILKDSPNFLYTYNIPGRKAEAVTS
jgi:hypothetical protein